MERRLEGLDLNLLLALHWLLTERNVTAAAGQLGLSQPAASRALSKLRDIFADPLLVKTGGAMVPTPLGERLRPATARAMERCQEVLRISEPFDPGKVEGRFRVACTDYIGAIVAQAWSTAVRPEAPGLSLDIVTATFEGARDMISGALDLTVIPDLAKMNIPPTVRVEDYVQRHVIDQRYVCAIRHDHPLAGKDLTLEDYISLDHILIAPGGTPRGLVDEALSSQGVSRRVAYTTDTFLLALPIVKDTDSVLTAPEPLVQLIGDMLHIFEPPVPMPRIGMYTVWHPNWTNNARHRFVRERLMEALPNAQNEVAHHAL